MAKITILGAGGFGVSLAIAAYQNQHQVTVWDISEQIVEAILRDGEPTRTAWNKATWWFLLCRLCISVLWHSV